jgi:hypothetical protein
MNKQIPGKSAPAVAGGEGAAALDRDIQLRIGEGLRAMYQDIVKQGVPDRFADLLKALDQQGGEKEESPQK